jgi:hypothetical protein
MTGWIVLPPLIGAIAGGFVGAWANSRFKNREVRRAEDEERNSLLFLIDTEVDFIALYALYLEAVSKGPPSGVIPDLRTDVWDTSRARLARLLPIGDMKKLAPYFELTRMVRSSEAAVKGEPGRLSDTVMEPDTRNPGLGIRCFRYGQIWFRNIYKTRII